MVMQVFPNVRSLIDLEKTLSWLPLLAKAMTCTFRLINHLPILVFEMP